MEKSGIDVNDFKTYSATPQLHRHPHTRCNPSRKSLVRASPASRAAIMQWAVPVARGTAQHIQHDPHLPQHPLVSDANLVASVSCTFHGWQTLAGPGLFQSPHAMSDYVRMSPPMPTLLLFFCGSSNISCHFNFSLESHLVIPFSRIYMMSNFSIQSIAEFC